MTSAKADPIFPHVQVMKGVSFSTYITISENIIKDSKEMVLTNSTVSHNVFWMKRKKTLITRRSHNCRTAMLKHGNLLASIA
jgi:hypothetical protein